MAKSDTEKASKDPIQDPPVVTDENEMMLPVDEIDEGLIVTSGGHLTGVFKPVKGTEPPDRKLFCISQRAVDAGQFSIGWHDYTPAQYAADREKYGTRFPVPLRPEGGRLWIRKHWVVWMRRDLWEKIRMQRRQRQEAVPRPNMLKRQGKEQTRSKAVVIRGGSRIENVDRQD